MHHAMRLDRMDDTIDAFKVTETLPEYALTSRTLLFIEAIEDDDPSGEKRSKYRTSTFTNSLIFQVHGRIRLDIACDQTAFQQDSQGARAHQPRLS